ncbi:MAG: hypothetical protein ACKVKA_10630 [Rhodobacterales bacterium]|jgi:hypothetical protein
MIRNRSDAYHRKGKKSAAYKLDSKCKSLCKNALEVTNAAQCMMVTLRKLQREK